MDKDLRDAYKALTLVRNDLVATRRENAALDARVRQQQEQLRELHETQRLRDEDWRARLVAADHARCQLLLKNELLLQELSTLRDALAHNDDDGGDTDKAHALLEEHERPHNNQLSTDDEEEEVDTKRVYARERQPQDEEEEEEHHDDNNNHRDGDPHGCKDKEDDSENESLVRERLGLLANLYELKVRLQQQTDALVEREALFAQARDEWALQQETLQHQLTQLQVTLLEVNSEKQFMEEKFEFLRTEVDVVRQERDALQRQLAETTAMDADTTTSTEAAEERRASVLATLREQLHTLRFELLATRAQLHTHAEQWQTECSHVDESLRHELSRFVAGLQQDARVELKSSEAKRLQLETALETLQRQLETTRLALDEAQQQSAEQEQNSVELEELRREIQELKSRLLERDAAVERLTEHETSQTELLAQLREELGDAEARLTEVSHREALLENALTQLRRQAAADETRNQELQRELQLRDDELTRFRQEMQELTLAMNDEVASVKASLSDSDEKQRRLQAELTDVTQRKDALKLELADATRELAMQEAAVVELQRELVEREHESVHRGHELTLLRGRIEELETHLSRRTEELEHVRSQISETLVREEVQREELTALRRDLAQRDEENKKHEQMLREHDDTIEGLRKELHEQRAEWDEQLVLRDDAMNGLRAVHREEMATAAAQHDDEMETLLQRMENYVKASECQLMALHDIRIQGCTDDDDVLSERLPPTLLWTRLQAKIRSLGEFLSQLQLYAGRLQTVFSLCADNATSLADLTRDEDSQGSLGHDTRVALRQVLAWRRVFEEEERGLNARLLRRRVMAALGDWHECGLAENGGVEPPPPAFGIDSREVALILQNWTDDEVLRRDAVCWLTRVAPTERRATAAVNPIKDEDMEAEMVSATTKEVNRNDDAPRDLEAATAFELRALSRDVKDALLMLVVPILRRQNAHFHVRVFTRRVSDAKAAYSPDDKCWEMRLLAQPTATRRWPVAASNATMQRPRAWSSSSSSSSSSSLSMRSEASTASSSMLSASSRLQIIQERLQRLQSNSS